MLGVSRANLTRVTRVLLTSGLVKEGRTELRASTGRPSELLELVPHARYFLGVKLTGEVLYAVVVNLALEIVASHEVQIRSREVADVVDDISDVLELFRPQFPIAGVGLSLAGTIQGTTSHQVVYESAFLNWDAVPLADLLEVKAGLPVSIENDVQALTLAESLTQPGSPAAATMALVTVGVGIGVGFVVGGSLVRGTHGRSGKLGHLIVVPAGPLCGSGHRGCVSSLLTNDSIARNAGTATYAEALEAARAGDSRAVGALDLAGAALGLVIATVVNALDPGVVILTGDGLALHVLAAPAINAAIAEALAWDAGPVNLDVREFDFSEWARAAAVAGINAALSDG